MERVSVYPWLVFLDVNAVALDDVIPKFARNDDPAGVEEPACDRRELILLSIKGYREVDIPRVCHREQITQICDTRRDFIGVHIDDKH